MKYLKKFNVQLVREASYSFDQDTLIGSPRDSVTFFSDIIGMKDFATEQIYVLYLNVRHRVIGCEQIGKGGTASCYLSPADVFRGALLAGAESVIIAHNHPSGNSSYSPDDIRTTKTLVAVGDMLGIKILDHIIVGYNNYTSLKEIGEI